MSKKLLKKQKKYIFKIPSVVKFESYGTLYEIFGEYLQLEKSLRKEKNAIVKSTHSSFRSESKICSITH